MIGNNDYSISRFVGVKCVERQAFWFKLRGNRHTMPVKWVPLIKITLTTIQKHHSSPFSNNFTRSYAGDSFKNTADKWTERGSHTHTHA